MPFYIEQVVISLSVEPDENQIGLQKMRLQLRYNQVTSLTKLRKSYRQKLIFGKDERNSIKKHNCMTLNEYISNVDYWIDSLWEKLT